MTSQGKEKKQVPIMPGLFTWPSDDPHLIGTRCKACGEVFFPQQPICGNCQGEELERFEFSKRAKLYSFTRVMYQPPPPWQVSGPFQPYGLGVIEQPEGVRFLSMLTEADLGKLSLDMDVEMVIEKQYEDEEGNEVMTYKFRPV